METKPPQNQPPQDQKNQNLYEKVVSKEIYHGAKARTRDENIKKI